MYEKYDVFWTETAEKDLKKIILYILGNSPGNELNILGKIRKEAESLCFMTERCRIVPELKQEGITLYRELIVKPWRIIFKISGSMVFIVSMIDSRRNIEDILFNRLIDG